MSLWHRGPARLTPNIDDPSPYPEVPYPWIVLFDPIPESLRKDMRTVDPTRSIGSARTPDMESAYLLDGAARVLDQLVQAAQEKNRGVANSTRLAFVSDSQNRVTGAYGVVARRMLSRDRFSQPLAELIAPDGNSENEAKRLGWSAANRKLAIFVHTEPREAQPRPAVFAVVRAEEDRDTFIYLARLLVTGGEISQWSCPDLETGADAVQ